MAGSWENRGKGVYRLTVDMGTDFQGKRLRKRKTVHCTSDRQADKELNKFWSECQSGKMTYTGKTTVSALSDRYLEVVAKDNMKKSTYSGYVSVIRVSIKPLLGNHEVSKITPLHIQEWVNYQTKKGLSPKTIQCRFTLLRGMFEKAVEWSMRSDNPCVKIRLPKYTKPEADFYTKTEVAELIEKLLNLEDKEYLTLKTAIMIDLFSGLRKGELYGLTWQKIDLSTGEYKVDSTRLYASEFGSFEDAPKTDSGNRTIMLPEVCLILLRRLKAQQSERKLLISQKWGPDEGLVILNPDTGRPLGANTLYKWFVAFLEGEGLRRTKRALHSLRHTNVSMIHSMNQNLSEISKWIGHSKTSTTLNIYTHLFNDNSKKDISDKLQESFAPIQSPKEKTNA